MRHGRQIRTHDQRRLDLARERCWPPPTGFPHPTDSAPCCMIVAATRTTRCMMLRVVQNRHQRREKDDARQHAEGERRQQPAVRRSSLRRRCRTRTSRLVDKAPAVRESASPSQVKTLWPGVGAQRQESERELQRPVPPAIVRHAIAADGRTHQPGQPHHHEQPGKADEPFHALDLTKSATKSSGHPPACTAAARPMLSVPSPRGKRESVRRAAAIGRCYITTPASAKPGP